MDNRTKNKDSVVCDDSEEEEEIFDCSNKTPVAENEHSPRNNYAAFPFSDISPLDLNMPLDIDRSSNNTQPNLDDLKQLEQDKKSIYAHPLFPLLALLFEKCEIATKSINSFDNDSSLSSFANEVEEFLQHQKSMGKSLFTNDPEVDSLMIKSIQVFRIHLLELEKVSELCKDFCQRYTSCLRTKMRSDVLLRNNSDRSNSIKKDLLDESHSNELTSAFLSSPTSSMSSISSPSSSVSCHSPLVHSSPPISPSLSASSARSSNPPPDLEVTNTKSSPSFLGGSFESDINQYYRLTMPKTSLNSFSEVFTENNFKLSPQNIEDDIVQDLSVKKKSSPMSTSNETFDKKLNKSPSSKDTEKIAILPKESVMNKTKSKSIVEKYQQTTNHSKRGVLPKQATSIMRSWLFQHIVHPYPTEDEKRAIATQTNLTMLQVNNWFINARRRILQPMLDSANNIHNELVNNNLQDMELSAKIKNGQHTAMSKKLKTSAHQINRFWPQSLANIIQTSDLNTKS